MNPPKTPSFRLFSFLSFFPLTARIIPVCAGGSAADNSETGDSNEVHIAGQNQERHRAGELIRCRYRGALGLPFSCPRRLVPAFTKRCNISTQTAPVRTFFDPDATLVYCESCCSARVFEPHEVKQFAENGWQRCCGEPVTLVSGAQYNRGPIPPLSGLRPR